MPTENQEPQVVITNHVAGPMTQIYFPDGAIFGFRRNINGTRATVNGNPEETIRMDAQLESISMYTQRQLSQVKIPHNGSFYHIGMTSVVSGTNSRIKALTIAHENKGQIETYMIEPDGSMKTQSTGKILTPIKELKF